jgi:tRNA threonylcarbamoyladenosine biosynthesis protein TsaB
VNLLALDTATEACSAALWQDGAISERFTVQPRMHTKLLLNMVDELMAEAQLSPQQLHGVVLSRGPGSFTGLRIATAAAQGIAFGVDVPVALVSTLATIAQDFFNRNLDEIAYTAMDARMHELFWGIYRRNSVGLAELIGDETVLPAERVPLEHAGPGVGVGSAWGVYGDILRDRYGALISGVQSDLLPRAACAVQIGADYFRQGLVVAPELALPVYLRDQVAKTIAERALIA